MSARHANGRDSNCCESSSYRAIRTSHVAKLLTRARVAFSGVDSAAFVLRTNGRRARAASSSKRALSRPSGFAHSRIVFCSGLHVHSGRAASSAAALVNVHLAALHLAALHLAALHLAALHLATADRALDCACVSAGDRRFNRHAAALVPSLHLSELAA